MQFSLNKKIAYSHWLLIRGHFQRLPSQTVGNEASLPGHKLKQQYWPILLRLTQASRSKAGLSECLHSMLQRRSLSTFGISLAVRELHGTRNGAKNGGKNCRSLDAKYLQLLSLESYTRIKNMQSTAEEKKKKGCCTVDALLSHAWTTEAIASQALPLTLAVFFFFLALVNVTGI